MKVASLMMAGQAANTTSLMGMTLMTEPLHNQVSTVNLCMCMFMCVNDHVMWAVSVSVLLYLTLYFRMMCLDVMK